METEYPWRAAYQRAVLETDNAKLPRLIDAARIVIRVRLRDLGSGGSYEEERAAIAKAFESLRILEEERLGSNSSSTKFPS
jgi:hypothetical protein